MRSFLWAVPWFVPGIVIAVIVGFLARRRVAAWLGSSPTVAWAVVVAFGLILAATLTPLREGAGDLAAGSCDFARVGFASLDDLRSLNDTSLNVLLFVPLGVVLAILPRSPRKAFLIVVACAMPLAIEFVQLVAIPLDRACESADVVDNLSGLAFGLALGALAGAIAGQADPSADRAGNR